MKLIQVEGYKAFHGDMNITPKNKEFEPFCIVNKDWLYRPDTKCWYGDGRSFPEDICEIVETNSESLS